MAKDYIRGEDNKLKILNGRFVFGEADEQNLRILAMSELGDFGINLLLGGRVKRMPHARNTDIAKNLQHLKLQMLMDNWKKESVTYENGELAIEGSRI